MADFFEQLAKETLSSGRTENAASSGQQPRTVLNPFTVDAIASEEGLTDAQKQVMSVLLNQESGYGRNARTSTDGARGVGQIMPATFQRYAKPGEQIDDPAHNLAVMARIIKDAGTKFGDDPAKIATAYFSGEGNVNRGQGSAWRADRADGNGKRVSSYVSDVVSRLNGSAPNRPQEQEQEWDQGARYIPMESMVGTDKPKPAEEGVVDGVTSLGKAVWQGAKSLGRSVMASGNTAVGDLSDVELLAEAQKADTKNNPRAMMALQEEIAKRKEANPDAAWWQALGDVGDAAWKNKLGTAQLIANQAPNSAVALGGAWAGGLAGAKLGAVAAPFTGGLSVPVGAGLGALTGMFLGNYAMEAGGKALDKAEGGFTPEEARQSMTEGAKKAAVVTAVDTATLGAGKLLGRTVFGAPVRAGARAEAQVLANAGVDITNKAAIARAVANNQALKEAAIEAGKQAAKDASKFGTRAAQAGIDFGMETAGEGVGEYYGEVAATGKGDIYDAALEALSSASQSGVQTVQAMRSAEGNNLDPSGIVRAARQSGGIVSRAGLAATPGAQQPAGQPGQPGQPNQAGATTTTAGSTAVPGGNAAAPGGNGGNGAAAAQTTATAAPNPYFADMDDESLKSMGEYFTGRQTMTDGTPITDEDRKMGQDALAELARRQAAAATKANQAPAAGQQNAIQSSAMSAIEQALEADKARKRAAGEVVEDDVTDVVAKDAPKDARPSIIDPTSGEMVKDGDPRYDMVLQAKGSAAPAMNTVAPTEAQTKGAKPGLSEESDPMLSQAIDVLRQGGRPSVSQIQGKLKIGFNRAARLLEEMEGQGIVSAMDEKGLRQILKLPDPPDAKASTPDQPAQSAGFSLPAFDNSPIPKMDPAAAEEQRRQAAEFEQKRKVRRAATRASSWDRNPFLAFLGANGINRDVANEFAPGPVEKRKAFVPGYGPVFRSGAKNLDELVQTAKEDGFLREDGDTTELYDLIERSLRGERIAPLYADGAAEAEGQRRQQAMQEQEGATFEDYLQQSEADDFDPFPLMADSGYDAQDLAGTDFDQADDAVRAEVAALAAQYADLGFDPADVLEALAIENENQPEQTYYDRARTRLTDLISQAYAQAQPQGNRDVRADRAEPLPAGEAGARGPAAGQQVKPAAPTPKLRNVDELAAEGFNRVVKQGGKTYFVNPDTRESVELDSPAQIARARARVQAKQRLGSLRNSRPQDFALDAVTPEALKARDEQAQAAQAQQTAEQQAAAEKAEADDERKRIEQASYAAADNFELGQNPLDSLTGQQDIFGAAPVTQTASPAATTREDALRLLADAYGDEIARSSLSDGTFGGAGLLNMDDNGNVILTRHASSIEGLNKSGMTMTPEELRKYADTGAGFGGASVNTSALEHWASNEWNGGSGVIGRYTIPLNELADLLRSNQAVIANIAQGEISLLPSVADRYLTHINGKSIGERIETTPAQAAEQDLAGERINDEWTAFDPQSGTLGIPRAKMPQIKAEHRGAMVNFLKARGIDGQQETIPSAAIKPTQAEFSPAKVKQAMDYQGGNRSIIVSADGYVVDGHHQWLAARENGEPIPAIRLDQNIGDVLAALKDMPSAQPEQGAKVESVAGLPDGARLETGTKGQAKGKVRYVDGNGEALGNWSDTESEALADARKNQVTKGSNAEAAQRFQQAVDRVRRKALAGDTLTDNDLESIGINPDGSEFPYMSSALQRLFGIQPRNVREAMGDAIRKGQGMYGGDKEFVPSPRRAIANAVQWMSSQPGMLYEQRNADRIARAKAADKQEAWDAITAEENADPERHFEGTDALRRAINGRRLDLKPDNGSFAIYPDRQQDDETAATDSQYPLVTHTTKKGKVLRGYIVHGMTLDEVKASIDPYALKKDGGVFVREQHKDKLPKPATSSSGRGPAASQAWKDEGKSPADLIAEKAQSVGRELAVQVAEESREQDFRPSEIPQAVEQWAADASVPADDLKRVLLQELPSLGVSEARIQQIRAALYPASKPATRDPSAGRAAAGGQVGVNGYFYKGGQFLPTTMAEPGKWKLDGKWVTSGREEVAPREWGHAPTPFSRSIYAMINAWTDLKDGNLSVRDGIRDYQGNPVTPDTEIRPGVRGVQGQQALTLQELIDAWNAGQRWFDVQPNAKTITTQEQTAAEPVQQDSQAAAGQQGIITADDVAAAEKQAAQMIEARIDAMKAPEVQRIAARFLPTVGVKVPMGKAKIKVVMTDAAAMNLLAPAGELGIELSESVKRALVAKMEGRVEAGQPAAQPGSGPVSTEGMTQAEAQQALESGQKLLHDDEEVWVDRVQSGAVDTYVIKRRDPDSSVVMTKGPAGPRGVQWGKQEAARKAVETMGLPQERALAGREGYDTLVELDAAQLKTILEQTRGEPLVDKPAKLEAWRNGTSRTDPAKFPIELVFRPDGKLDVNDGRHRIALAAERGEKVTAFIDGKDVQRVQALLEAANNPGVEYVDRMMAEAQQRLDTLRANQAKAGDNAWTWDKKIAEAEQAVAAYQKVRDSMTGNKGTQSVSLKGKAAGDVLVMGNGTLYRIEGIDVARNFIRLVRNPNMLSERIVSMGQDDYDRLLADDEQTRNEALQQSSSPAIQDFIDGKRHTAPTLEEVQAKTLAKLEKEIADWQVRRDLPVNQAQTGLIDAEIAKLQAQVEALRGATGQEDELDSEMQGYERKAQAEEAARYLKDFVYSLGNLDGMTDRAQVVLGTEKLGKSGRDTLLMKAFGLTREEAHDINNRLDSRQPKKLRNVDMQEAFAMFPGLREMVDEAIQKAAGKQPAATVDADLEAIFDQLDGLTQRTQADGQRAAAAHPKAERIQFVQKHILDILQDLEDTGKVSINC